MSDKRSIDRRNFLRGATGAAALSTAGLVGCGGSQATDSAPAVHTRQNVRWRLASSFPRGLDTLYGASTVLGERLEALSGGCFSLCAIGPSSGDGVAGMSHLWFFVTVRVPHKLLLYA